MRAIVSRVCFGPNLKESLPRLSCCEIIFAVSLSDLACRVYREDGDKKGCKMYDIVEKVREMEAL